MAAQNTSNHAAPVQKLDPAVIEKHRQIAERERAAAEKLAYALQHPGDGGGIAGGAGNDECATAIAIGDGVTNWCNNNATASPDAVTCGFLGAGGGDVWFDYTASCTGPARATTCDNGQAGMDTCLQVWDACGGTVRGCDDDGGGCAGQACGFSGSVVTWAATAGTHYKIRVWGYNTCRGCATLTLSCTVGGGGNDECTGATAVGEGTFPFDNTTATTSEASPCAFDGNDIYYRYTPSSSGSALVQTCGLTGLDTTLAAYDNCNGNVLACIDDACGLQSSITFSVSAGVPVIVRLAGFASQTGTGSISFQILQPPSNDSCGSPTAVGDGTTNFSNIGASTDGPDSGLCCFFGDCSIGSDIWYCYTASCNGDIVVSLCGSSYDTKMAVYDGCACPQGDPLVCNDDFCGLQSQVRVRGVTQGQHLLIRIGGYVGSQGTGTMTISCVAPCQDLPCPQGGVNENEPCGSDTNGGCNSAPPAYFAASSGVPICGETWASGGTRDTEWFQFCTSGGDITCGGSSQIPLVLFILNNDCSNIQLLALGEIPECGTGSVTGNFVAGTYVAFAAPGSLNGGIFDGYPCGGTNAYVLTATFTAASGGRCCLANGDCIEVADAQACANAGGGNFRCGATCASNPCPAPVVCPPGASQENEACGTDTNGGCNSAPPAYGHLNPNETVCGESWAQGGTRDTDWYRFCHAGGDVTWGGFSEVPQVLFILNDNCANIQLLAIGNIEAGSFGSVTVNLPGGNYVAFAAPGTAGGGGIFDGFPCDGVNNDYALTLNYTLCAPTGACCQGSNCSVLTQAACAQANGSYRGDNTDCGQFTYTVTPGNNAIEDISGTGALGCVGDDCSSLASLGFTFSYFGTSETDINVGSNGHMRFAGPATVFGNPFSLPTADGYDSVVAPYWDDWRTDGACPGAAIYTQTLGSAPNRRFVAQWVNVCHFSNNAQHANFEAILYEGSNNIEYRWGNPLDVNSPVSGIENFDGTQGVDVTANAQSGASVLLHPQAANNPCANPCGNQVRGDANCDGVVNNFDIDCFVLALTNPVQWAAQCSHNGQCTLSCVADINRDGAVNNFDIDPFVICLTHNGCQ